MAAASSKSKPGCNWTRYVATIGPGGRGRGPGRVGGGGGGEGTMPPEPYPRSRRGRRQRRQRDPALRRDGLTGALRSAFVLFPARVLAFFPSPPGNQISLGPLHLRAYGVLIALGVVAAVWLADRRWVAGGGAAGTMSSLALWAVPAGLIGARLY